MCNKNKKKKIKDLELQVDNLVNQLANFSNSTASTYIIEKIEELKQEIYTYFKYLEKNK